MEQRINHIEKIRAGTEEQNFDNWCEKCGKDLTFGGVKICYENWLESMLICKRCMPVGKID